MHNSANQKKLIIITGPTAVGKTELCLKAGKLLDTPIISADSRQIYKEMKIGTAKASLDQLSQVPHHFINHISIHDPYSTGQYEREAIELIQELFKTKAKLIVSGGTGLYLKAITEGLDHFPAISATTQLHYNELYQEKGIKLLQKELEKVDPAYASKVDIHNHRRLIRALSVFKESGKPYSQFLLENKKQRDFKTLYIVLTRNREELYQRINMRVDQMMEDGLLTEAESLYKYKNRQALQTVGYKELFKFIQGEWDLPTAIDKIKQHSRNYAKRQMTWFRGIENATFMPAKDYKKALTIIQDF